MPEVSPQPSQPIQPQVQPEQGKGISWKKILVSVGVIAVVAGIIAGALYWYFVINEEETTTTETTKVSTPSSKQATPSAKKEKDETADWKTYTNSSLGFSIKYPSGWYTKETPSNPSSPLTYASISEKTTSDVNSGFVLTVTADSDEFLEKEYNETKKLEISKATSGVIDSGPHVVERLPNTKVDNLTGLVWTEKPEGENSTVPYNQTVYVKKGTKFYKIWTTAETQTDFNTYQKKFNLMLSTFKFLD